MCANCRNLAWVLGPLLAVLLIAASTASADTAVVGLSPKVARPGERVDLRVVCGACRRADTSFPISLVPVAKAPPPHPCRVKLKGHTGTGLCSRRRRGDRQEAVRAARQHEPGTTSAARGIVAAWFELDLSFAVPEIEPGRYAFVIFCAECGRRSRGSLIADISLPASFFGSSRARLRCGPPGAVRIRPGGSSQVSGPSRWCSRPACCSVGGKQYEH